MEMMSEMIYKLQYFSSFWTLLLSIFFVSAFMKESKKKKYTAIMIIGAVILAGIMNAVFWKYKELFVREDKNPYLFDYEKNLLFVLLLILIQCIYFHRKIFLGLIATSIYVNMLMVVEVVVILITYESRGWLTHEERVAQLQISIVMITFMTLLLRWIAPKTKISSIYLLLGIVITFVSSLSNWIIFGGGERFFDFPEWMRENLGIYVIGGNYLFQIILIILVLKIGENNQQKQTNALIEIKNEMLQKSLDETEQTFELWRQSVHDYKNHVIVLRQLLAENRVDEIKSFLEEEYDTLSKQLFMIRTGNSVVDTLVNLKRSLAEKHHIAFMVHGTLPEKLVVENMDLANILGNLLDNAIEASMKEQEGYIDLTIKQEKNFLIINLHNKCTRILDKEIDKSSKKNPEFHGIGLKSVKRAVKKYDGQINIENTPQEFIVNILIQNTQEN